MKILIVTPIFPPRTGGPATYIWELSQRLKKKHKIKIICFSSRPKTQKGIEIINISEVGSSLSRQATLMKTVYNQSIWADVVYVQGPLVVGVSTTIASKLKGKKVILKFVGDEVWESAQLNRETELHLEEFYQQPLSITNSIKKWCQKLSFTLSDRIIVPSNYLKQFLIKYHRVKDKKITVISNAIEISQKIETKKIKQLIYVGRLVPWKNIDKIILAVKKAKEIQPWRLVIIGEGPEELKLNNLVKQIKADKWIAFEGRLTHKETLQEIAKSEKLILYSNYEGLSHTLIEAMLLKTAVIASDILANREVLEEHGEFVSLNNVPSLSKAINKKQKINLISAQSYAKNTYNWQKHVSKLEKIFYEKEN